MTVPASSIPTSTVPAVKDWLASTAIPGWLDADAGGSDPNNTVTYDEPSVATQLGDTAVAVVNVVQEQEPARMVGGGGPGWMDETYTVELLISVYRGGDNARAADQRLWHVHALLSQGVRADPSLGGRVVRAYVSGMTTEADWDNAETGRISSGVTHVHVDAVI